MKSSDYLANRGPFSKLIDGYQVRDNQLALCDSVEHAIDNDNVLVAEAGTGIGKTYAYLIPAIRYGKKVIISTGTKHLQDQLHHTDIPKVQKALDIPVRTALLKGRSNYLCLHRLEIAPHLGFVNKTTQTQLKKIRDWSGLTSTGDISELSRVPEDSITWSLVTSTTDNCLGGECSYWNDCHVVQARKKAQDADILVINHHLLLADMTLKEEGFADLLPGADAFVIDEAHQLHDVATKFFGDSVTSRQLISLAKDAVAEHVNDAPDMSEIQQLADQLEKSTSDFRLALGDSGIRQAWMSISNKPVVVNIMAELIDALSELSRVLEVASERSRALDQCYQRSLVLKSRLEVFSVGEKPSGEKENDQAEENNLILWYETYTKSFLLHSTPIEIAKLFRKYTENFSGSWIFTSATLQVNKNFNHFTNAVGLEDFSADTWSSPFDYKSQSLLYLPSDMPEPSDFSFTSKLIEKALPVIKASNGRAFLLFTSYRAMNTAAELLENRLDYPVFIQGDLPKHELLSRFREAGNAVLLGTSSFWEGVDVRGGALSCVIIDKLPFASPGDPVMQARIDAIRKSGGQPFMEYQVPQAVIALKQGVGRLIRDINDHGVVMIGDPRLKSKAYGRIFLNSLPSMPHTSNLPDVEEFFKEKTSTLR